MNHSKQRLITLVSGSLILFCLGVIYIWSIFRAPIETYFADGQGGTLIDAGMTFSITMVTFVLGILISGRLQDVKGPRIAVLLGGILFSAGILIASFAPPTAPVLIHIFYGGVAGFGVGSAYTAAVSCVQKWFPDKRGLATGIMVCSFGASTVVFSPVASNMLATLDVMTILRIFAIVFFIVVIIFVWFIKNPPEDFTSKAKASAKTPMAASQFTASEALHTKELYILVLLMMFATPAYFILNPMLKSLAAVKGLTDAQAVIGVMVTGIASAAGRLVFPAISDAKGRKFSIYLLYIITIASTVLLSFMDGIIYIVLIALITFCYGGSSGVFPAITADYFGTKSVGTNYGIVMLGFAAAAILFPALASNISASTGNPEAPLMFILPAIACAVGILLTAIIKPPVKKNLQ